jgi:hypothetical protein
MVDPFKLELTPTSQKTHCISIEKIKLLLTELVVVYFDHLRNLYASHGHNAAFLNPTAGGTHSDHFMLQKIVSKLQMFYSVK